MFELITILLWVWVVCGWLAWRLWVADFVGSYPSLNSPKAYEKAYKILYDHEGAEAVRKECLDHFKAVKRDAWVMGVAGPIGLIVMLFVGRHRNYGLVREVEKEFSSND